MTYEEAIQTIPLGKYRHFKGNEYEVIGIARHSETEEAMVVYRALYGDGGLWTKPADMWNERLNIIHFAAAKKHVGLYPGPAAVEQFAERLKEAGCKYSKGSIQIPYSDELPLNLISAIAAWCRDTGNHA